MELFREFYEKRRELLGTFLIGLLGHFVKLTNYLPTSDSIYCIENTWAGMSTFGRWFSGVSAITLSGFADLQWVEGTVAIFFLSLTILTLLHIFHVQSPVLRIIAIALFMFFPATGSTMVYMIWAAPYALAYFLAVYALYLCICDGFNIRRGLIAVVSVALSGGIYQIYLTTAAICFAYYLVMRLLSGASVRSLIRPVLTTGIVFLAGLICYFLMGKLVLHFLGKSLSTYQGISGAGNVSHYIIRTALRTIRKKLTAFYFGAPGITAYRLLNLAIIPITFIGWGIALFCKKMPLWNRLVCIPLLLVTPLFSYGFQFVSFDTSYHSVMEGGNYFVYFGLILLLDALPARWKKLFVCICTLLGLLCFYHFINTNTNYKQMEISYQRTSFAAMEILAKMDTLPGASEVNTVALCGNFAPGSYSISANPDFYGAGCGNFIYSSFLFCQFSDYYLGRNLTPADDAVSEQLMQTAQYAAMDCYPYGDYAQIIDGIFVIKLS